MLGIHDLPLFIVSGLLLNITPGPDMLYIIGRGSAHGPRAGMAAALGVGAGCLVHIAAAALGLSALLATSATAFTALKLVGAAYLVYVGLGMLLARGHAGTQPPATESASAPVRAAPTLRRIFVQGFCTNALNPKVALFFLAFLPQFIDPASPNAALAFLVLGLLFNVNGTLWNLLVGWSAARMAAWLSRSAQARFTGRLGRWCNRAVGGVFVYFGIRLAMAET